MKTIVVNRKAYYDYLVGEKYLGGLKLLGAEIKSVRSVTPSIEHAYCYMNNGELFIKQMNIPNLPNSGYYGDFDSVRDRKILLNKKELIKIGEEIKRYKKILIPLSLVFTKNGFLKVELGLCLPKKNRDKRMAIKDREKQLEIKKTVQQHS
jgi:SsrA-binding protein